MTIRATPHTAETTGLFGAEQFRAMKPQARFINVGRGSAVDQPALVEALTSGEIAGAALDVFAEEPLPPDDPLWEMANVIVSPHMSGDYVGHQEAMAQGFLENFERYVGGEPLRNLVDKSLGFAASRTDTQAP